MSLRPGRHKGVVLDRARMRAARARLTATQSEIAASAGISTRSYQNAENGRAISGKVALRLCDVLGTAYRELVRLTPDEVMARLRNADLAPAVQSGRWVNRSAECAAVTEALRACRAGGVTCLLGPAGIGKTSIARRLAPTLLDEYPDGIVWLSGSRAQDDPMAAALLARVAATLAFGHQLPPSHLVDLPGYLLAFGHGLWSQDRLLIVDDVPDVAAGNRYVGVNPRGPVLLTTTSRAVVDRFATRELIVGPLAPGAALDLLAAELGASRVGANKQDAERMCEILGRVPRHLLIACDILLAEPELSLSEYVIRLEGGRADSPGSIGMMSEESGFEGAYIQLRERLHERTWLFFGALHVFGDASFDIDWAAAAGGIPDEEAAHHLSSLVDVLLVHDVTPEQVSRPLFRMDTQAQRVACGFCGDAAPAIVTRVDRYALREAGRLSARGAARAAGDYLASGSTWAQWCDAASTRLIGSEPVVSRPEEIVPLSRGAAEHARDFTSVLDALCRTVYLHDSSMLGRWLSAGVRVAHTLGDRRAEGVLARELAKWWAHSQFSFDNARPLLEHSVELLVDAGAHAEAFGAQCYRVSVDVPVRRPRELVEAQRYALEIAAIGELDPAYEAYGLFTLASFLATDPLDAGDWDLADEYMQRALELAGTDTEAMRAQRACLLVSHATMQALRGRTIAAEEVEFAVDCLYELVADNPLDRWRIASVGSLIGGTRWKERARVNDETRRSILLGITKEEAPRQLGRVIDLVCNIAGHPGTGFDPRASDAVVGEFASGRVALGSILFGTIHELELGHIVSQLYPVDALHMLVAGTGLHYLRTFVTETVGPQHPAGQLLDHLEYYLAG